MRADLDFTLDNGDTVQVWFDQGCSYWQIPRANPWLPDAVGSHLISQPKLRVKPLRWQMRELKGKRSLHMFLLGVDLVLSHWLLPFLPVTLQQVSSVF
jgi:hypothetical protein